jgi:hypothetical protein
MKKVIMLLTIVCASYMSGNAKTEIYNNFKIEKYSPQSEVIKIKGRIIDKKTGEPVPYVNIAIVGVPIGTISNQNGDFELKIPGQLEDREFSISAIGYGMISLSVAEYKAREDVLIELIPEEYKIEEVDIQAKSLVFYKRIKETIGKFNDNYYQKPYNYDIYYRCEKMKNDTLTRLREAAVKIYDSKGYVRNNTHKVFKQRNYKFLQVKRNFESSSLADASTNLDDLLEMDIVRISGNVLDKKYLDLFDLKLERITEYDNDSVWVISYKCEKPKLSYTGDYYAVKYEGKLYINQKDMAVVKNETSVESSNYSELGRSFYVNEDKQGWKRNSVKYDFTVIYKKHSGFYYLSYVNYNRYHVLENKKTGIIKNEQIKTEMMINKIEIETPEKIEQRAYYENIPFDKDFWENYNYMPDIK